MDSLRHPRRLSVLSLVAVASLTLLAATPAAVAYEGYGYPTVGGQGGTTYHVTNTKGDTSDRVSPLGSEPAEPQDHRFRRRRHHHAVGFRGDQASLTSRSMERPRHPRESPSVHPVGGRANALVHTEALTTSSSRACASRASMRTSTAVTSSHSMDNSTGSRMRSTTSWWITAPSKRATTGRWTSPRSHTTSPFRGASSTTTTGPQLIKYGVRQRLSIHHNVYASSPRQGHTPSPRLGKSRQSRLS